MCFWRVTNSRLKCNDAKVHYLSAVNLETLKDFWKKSFPKNLLEKIYGYRIIQISSHEILIGIPSLSEWLRNYEKDFFSGKMNLFIFFTTKTPYITNIIILLI